MLALDTEVFDVRTGLLDFGFVVSVTADVAAAGVDFLPPKNMAAMPDGLGVFPAMESTSSSTTVTVASEGDGLDLGAPNNVCVAGFADALKFELVSAPGDAASFDTAVAAT